MDSKLPIIAKKKIIAKYLKENSILILEGETGSGKSTQLPQILCEHFGLFDSHQQKAILIT
jgi:HrpA-like RNA helicase